MQSRKRTGKYKLWRKRKIVQKKCDNFSVKHHGQESFAVWFDNWLQCLSSVLESSYALELYYRQTSACNIVTENPERKLWSWLQNFYINSTAEPVHSNIFISNNASKYLFLQLFSIFICQVMNQVNIHVPNNEQCSKENLVSTEQFFWFFGSVI